MSVPNTLLDSLNTKKIPYEILPHAKAYTARMAAEAEAIPSEHQAKVVIPGVAGLPDVAFASVG